QGVGRTCGWRPLFGSSRGIASQWLCGDNPRSARGDPLSSSKGDIPFEKGTTLACACPLSDGPARYPARSAQSPRPPPGRVRAAFPERAGLPSALPPPPLARRLHVFEVRSLLRAYVPAEELAPL